MGNLWLQQEDTRRALIALIADLANRWESAPFDVHFVTQGKYVLSSYSYPRNWRVSDRVDQGGALNEADVFVTHGGSNSFHEALVRRVPMVAVPFFGDQPAVARRIEELGVGLSVGWSGVDTKDAVSAIDGGLAARIDTAVRRILLHPESFSPDLALEAHSVESLLKGRIPFQNGDLLYGTTVARSSYVEETRTQEEFQMFKYLPFSKIAPSREALPRIVDIYHDAIRDPTLTDRESRCGMNPYARLISEYQTFLNGETDVAEMCMRGLDFFAQRFRIHFILDEYDPSVNLITSKEIGYVLANRERFEPRVTFYRKAGRTWIPVSFDNALLS